MNFIKVHNIEGGDLLINIDKVATIYPRTAGGAVVNYFDGSTAPVTETVDELAAMLLPGPVVIKAEEPRPTDVRPIEAGAPEPCGAKGGTFRGFLEMISTKSRKRCHKPGCDGCPLQGLETTCVTFTGMTDGDIELLVKAYADFEIREGVKRISEGILEFIAEETEKKQEASNA